MYSAAAVLYELLSGTPPFVGVDLMTTLRAHREDPAPALRDHGPEVQGLLTRALSKAPAERPADAAAFLAELEEAASRRYGAGWLSAASIAGLASAGAGGMAATAAVTASAGSAAVTSTAAGTVEAIATASAETGSAPTATGAVLQTGRRAGRVRHAIGAHPVVAGGVGVVVVAAAVTVTAVAASGKSKPKPSPQAILLASAPLGSFSATGSITSSTDATVKTGKVGTFPWAITETCTATSCSAVVKAPGSTFHFTYAGDTFTSHSLSKSRVTCVNTKTGKKVPGSTALQHHDLAWTMRVTKRVPATADGPGRALELSGTVVETNSYTDFTKNCEDIGVIRTQYAYTVTRK